MGGGRWCDFHALEQAISSQYPGDIYGIHGLYHWRRVERHGLWLSARTGADAFVVRLFAWFHDSRRFNDATDDGHGSRGADHAAELRGRLFDLEDDAFSFLVAACRGHTDQLHSEDATIGTCWDADRLDLGRVGIIPSSGYMSTGFGKEVADAGSFYSFLTEKERAAASEYRS